MGLRGSILLQLGLGFVFVASGLVINLIQLVTCLLWPISKQLYRRINTRLAYSLWSQVVMVYEWWSGSTCTLFVHERSTLEHLGQEHAFIILNHNYEIDFVCGWAVAERYGVLGSSKVLAKHELLRVPLIGWTWYFLEIVFCRRSWEEDRVAVTSGLKQLRDYPQFIWLLLYCEGTRFTEEKHRLSMEVADSKGLPRLKHHLLPRTRGFTTSLHCLRGTVEAVYDVTLSFRDRQAPTLLDIVKGRTFHADMILRRFPVEQIPEDEKECADWLHRLYQEKDQLREQYFATGRFPGNAVVPPRRPWTLLNFLLWTGLLLTPVLQLSVWVVASGNLILILGLVLFMIAASVCIQRLISVSEIKKTGSSYGVQHKTKES